MATRQRRRIRAGCLKLRCPILLVGLAVGNLHRARAEDPLERRPPQQRPELRNTLSAEEFRSRWEAARPVVGDWKAWESSRAPIEGAKLVSVFPDGQAQRLGLKPGDILWKLDGVILTGEDLPSVDGVRRIEVYSASENRLRTVTVQPGPLGVQFINVWNPEVLYLREPGRTAQIDPWILGAIRLRGREPQLAEAALREAVLAGYPQGLVTDQLAADLALINNEPARAAAFAWYAEQMRDETDRVCVGLLIRVALANHHLREAVRLMIAARGAWGSDVIQMLAELIALHESRPLADRALPPPSEQIATMTADPWRGRLRGVDWFTRNERFPEWEAGKTVLLEAEAAQFMEAFYEPTEPTPHIEISHRFRPANNKGTLDGFLGLVVLGWTDRHRGESSFQNAAEDSEIRSVEASVSEFGELLLQFGPGRSDIHLIDSTFTGFDAELHEMRILRVGGAMEIFLNGHRVFYGPTLPGDRGVKFCSRAIASAAQVEQPVAIEYLAPARGIPMRSR